MNAKKETQVIQGTKQEFLKIFREMCYSRSAWQVWADLISMIACTLANSTDPNKNGDRYLEREKEFKQCEERLGGVDKPAQCMAVIVQALERNPEQDFLGELFMELELGNHWKGQFFTPYCVCKAMANIAVGEAERQIGEKGYISVCDPACGAGATLIAAVSEMKLSNYNFQNHVLFVGQELWIMPMFRVGAWTWRRMFCSIRSMSPEKNREQSKEKFYMFFDFEKENADGKQCETLYAGAK